MAAIRFLSVVAGRLKEIAGIVISTGAGDDGKLVALDATGKIDASVLPSGVGQNTASAAASEALAANDLVNFWNDGGTIKVRKADATTEGKEAHGFTKASHASASTATIYLPGNILTGLTGLTPGARQYLATSAGARTETPPSAAGNVLQAVGVAASTTSVVFEPEEPITRA